MPRNLVTLKQSFQILACCHLIQCHEMFVTLLSTQTDALVKDDGTEVLLLPAGEPELDEAGASGVAVADRARARVLLVVGVGVDAEGPAQQLL